MKRYLQKAIAFSGPSNSGKTTLIEKITNVLIKDYKILIIKHDPKDKAVFDTKGKDSYKFFQTGADTIVLSPTRTTIFSHQPTPVEEIIKKYEFDFLFVEGLKEINLPRISVFRQKIQKDYLAFSNAIAIDNSIDISFYQSILPKNIEILNLNDINQIIKWIKINAKETK